MIVDNKCRQIQERNEMKVTPKRLIFLKNLNVNSFITESSDKSVTASAVSAKIKVKTTRVLIVDYKTTQTTKATRVKFV